MTLTLRRRERGRPVRLAAVYAGSLSTQIFGEETLLACRRRTHTHMHVLHACLYVRVYVLRAQEQLAKRNLEIAVLLQRYVCHSGVRAHGAHGYICRGYTCDTVRISSAFVALTISLIVYAASDADAQR